MHINVRDILAEDVGYNRTYTIANERPSFGSLKLTQDIEGEIRISRLESGVLLTGFIQTALELECHRCLSTFTRPVRRNLKQVYAEQPRPEEEELPIEDDAIDLAPLIEQEILVSLPIKILCRIDCPGVPGAETEYTSDKPSTRIGDKARITKGTQRGRTEETNHS
jgi:uncharacterized metal-binding protein YceD (DUF177 family)